MIAIIISVAASLYAIIGIILASIAWKQVEYDYSIGNPDLTEQQLKQKFFLHCLFCWPALIEKVEFGIEIEDDDDDKKNR